MEYKCTIVFFEVVVVVLLREYMLLTLRRHLIQLGPEQKVMEYHSVLRFFPLSSLYTLIPGPERLLYFEAGGAMNNNVGAACVSPDEKVADWNVYFSV